MQYEDLQNNPDTEPQDIRNQRLTTSQKNAKNKLWYKRQVDYLDNFGGSYNINVTNDKKSMKVNYDLYNNIIDTSDYEYLCKPYDNTIGEMPVKMTNRDIISAKVNSLLGMEMKRPFTWKVVAVNPEATTRKEQMRFNLIKEYTTKTVDKNIDIALKILDESFTKSRDLTPEEIDDIKNRAAEDYKTKNPDEINKYMHREYQDPAEMLSHQLLEYLIKKKNLKVKFNEIFKHALISARGIAYISIVNEEPDIQVVNPLYFNYDRLSNSNFIEDGEWATYLNMMTPSRVLEVFGEELTEKEIDDIYRTYGKKFGLNSASNLDLFSFSYNSLGTGISGSLTTDEVPVLHVVWRSLRKVGFLTYIDPDTAEEAEKLVSEEYKLDEDAGDIKLEWSWIPEVYEGFKIKTPTPIYVKMRPVPGQFKDLSNPYYCKLPYYGVIYDTTNSIPTSIIDRLKPYQYLYNIVMYNIERLMASDKGKKILMNIGMVPNTNNFDFTKFLYYMESSSMVFINPSQEGAEARNAQQTASVLDLSLSSDIQKYMQFADYLKEQAGISVGITPQIEGQISSEDRVRNTQQALIQSANLLEPYFNLHSIMKGNILQALIETTKVAYTGKKAKKLAYVLDDLSMNILSVDAALLEDSTLGIFISDDSRAQEIKENLIQLAHAALQNNKISFSEIISMFRSESTTEAIDKMKESEEKSDKNMQKQQEQQAQLEQQTEAKKAQFLETAQQKELERQKELLTLKAQLDREAIILKAQVEAKNNEYFKDDNQDGINDYLQLAAHDLKAKQVQDKSNLESQKLDLQKNQFDQQNKLADKKMSLEEQKLRALKQNKVSNKK